MTRLNTSLTAAFLSTAILVTSPTPAMTIEQFDKMAGKDQGDYLVLLIEGAQKVLIDEGKNDLAATLHKLFTDIPPGDDDPAGVTQFEMLLARTRLADLERTEKDPNTGRLHVEHVMIMTVKINDITLPKTFMQVGNAFRPRSTSEPDSVLKVTTLENGCFEIQRESQASGLRIPRRVVCSVTTPSGEGGQEPAR